MLPRTAQNSLPCAEQPATVNILTLARPLQGSCDVAELNDLAELKRRKRLLELELQHNDIFQTFSDSLTELVSSDLMDKLLREGHIEMATDAIMWQLKLYHAVALNAQLPKLEEVEEFVRAMLKRRAELEHSELNDLAELKRRKWLLGLELLHSDIFQTFSCSSICAVEAPVQEDGDARSDHISYIEETDETIDGELQKLQFIRDIDALKAALSQVLQKCLEEKNSLTAVKALFVRTGTMLENRERIMKQAPPEVHTSSGTRKPAVAPMSANEVATPPPGEASPMQASSICAREARPMMQLIYKKTKLTRLLVAPPYGDRHEQLPSTNGTAVAPVSPSGVEQEAGEAALELLPEEILEKIFVAVLDKDMPIIWRGGRYDLDCSQLERSDAKEATEKVRNVKLVCKALHKAGRKFEVLRPQRHAAEAAKKRAAANLQTERCGERQDERGAKKMPRRTPPPPPPPPPPPLPPPPSLPPPPMLTEP